MSIWLLAVRLGRPLTAEETAALTALLPPERLERLARLRQPEKWREPLCAYGLLRRALWERYGWPDLPQIRTDARGKPFFPDHPGVHFNLSHTRGAVLAALADSPVGVDIERVRPVGRRLKERLAPGGTEEDFFRVWVRREARSKRSGAGVASMLSTEPPPEPGERFYELDIYPGYMAGAAALDGEILLPLRRRELEDLTGAFR